MKLLILEYITGGGFNAQPLPASLLREGGGMLQALLADCQRLPELRVRVMLEARCQQFAQGYPVETILVSAIQDMATQLQHALPWAEAVWIIAPEMEGILYSLCLQVEAVGKHLLISNTVAVALTSDKWQTYQLLLTLGLPTVPTQLLTEHEASLMGSWVIKPIDGVGCGDTWRVNNTTEFASVVNQLDNPQNYLIQPYIVGMPASLSCLFSQGYAKILTVNQQIIVEEGQQFRWLDSKVNILPITAAYQHWVDVLAKALPGLNGYVGIDFILGTEASWILEINPRLTSSYVNLYVATGINLMAEVLQASKLQIAN